MQSTVTDFDLAEDFRGLKTSHLLVKSLHSTHRHIHTHTQQLDARTHQTHTDTRSPYTGTCKQTDSHGCSQADMKAHTLSLVMFLCHWPSGLSNLWYTVKNDKLGSLVMLYCISVCILISVNLFLLIILKFLIKKTDNSVICVRFLMFS